MHENDNEMPGLVETKSIKIPDWKTMDDSLLKADSVILKTWPNNKQKTVEGHVTWDTHHTYPTISKRVNIRNTNRLDVSTSGAVPVFRHLGVSKNRGTPKWMVYNGKPENPIKMDDLGVPLFLETPTFLLMGPTTNAFSTTKRSPPT